MTDTTLTNGLLTRLDALTAKMGVAATEIWNIWLATSWRPALNYGIALVIGLVALGVGLKLVNSAIEKEKNLDDGAWPGVPGVLLTFMGVIFTAAALCNAADAIAYVIEPRLYAFDQLRRLIGK